jgi:hypothetical protein
MLSWAVEETRGPAAGLHQTRRARQGRRRCLALGQRERGIEVWLDAWEMGPGHNFVARINAGLEQATAEPDRDERSAGSQPMSHALI